MPGCGPPAAFRRLDIRWAASQTPSRQRLAECQVYTHPLRGYVGSGYVTANCPLCFHLYSSPGEVLIAFFFYTSRHSEYCFHIDKLGNILWEHKIAGRD